MARFGGHDREQLGWFSIDLSGIGDPEELLAKTTNRLRNTIDRERRRRLRSWDRLELAALFVRRDDWMSLEGFVHYGEVAPQEFARALANAWSIEAVRVEPFSGESTVQCIRESGARWHTGPETTLPSFRSKRVAVGPKWSKATRHGPPVTSRPAYLEPLPISIGYDDLGAGAWWSS